MSLCLVLTGLFVGFSIRRRPQAAIGLVIAVAYCMPAWVLWPAFGDPQVSLVGSGIDVKVAVGVVCLALYCFMPGRTFPVRLVWADFAMIGLILVHIISDTTNDGLSALGFLSAFGEWYVPYVAGRIAIQTRADLDMLWRPMSCLAISLAILALIECITRINLFEMLFGTRPLEGFSREASRWGLKRAYGPTMHPIYFGVLQLLLLGWALFAAVRAVQRRARIGWIFAPPLCIAGICATLSRGPVLAIGVTVVVAAFLLMPRLRLAIAAFTVIGAIGIAANFEAFLGGLEEVTGARQRVTREIVVDEEALVHTGTRNRLNLLAVYRVALARSGLLGFGSQSVRGFPVNVPVGPRDADTLKKTRFIDNAYVLLTLRFGYLGVSCFCIAAILSLWQFSHVVSVNQPRAPAWLAGCLAASLAASLTVLITVWMPHDHGFPLLWTMGVSSGMLLAFSERPVAVHSERKHLPKDT